MDCSPVHKTYLSRVPDSRINGVMSATREGNHVPSRDICNPILGCAEESKKSGKVEGAGLRCRFAILDGRLHQIDDSSSMTTSELVLYTERQY
jgi:hypothetical protein